MMLYPNGTTTRPTVSSPFGPRKGGVSSFHHGADLVGFTTIRAVAAGRVTFAGWMNNAAGNAIVIDHGGGVASVYMHNKAHHVARRATVSEGQAIATMGDTGNATGPCNHLEIRVKGVSVEPLSYIAARLTRTGTPTGTPTTPEAAPIQLEDTMIRIQSPGRGIAIIGTGYYRHLTNDEEVISSEPIITKHLNGNDRQFDLWVSMSITGDRGTATANSDEIASKVLTAISNSNIGSEIAAAIPDSIAADVVAELSKRLQQ